MDQSRQPAGILRFGAFEADLHTGELRKTGAKVRIQELPFRVLVALLEKQGTLVTREELQKRLWPEDTFVDFDQGLGTAIRKLREALGDSAENPRFIETLPRRGFRFITPVHGNGVAAEQRDLAAVGKTAIPQRENAAPQVAGSHLPRTRVVVALAVLAIAVLAVGVAYLLRPALPAPRVSGYTQLSHDNRPKAGTGVLVTDGTRVYFSEDIDGRDSLAAVSIAGGDTVLIRSWVETPTLEDISPDGTELLVTDRARSSAGFSPIFVVRAVDGLTRRVGDVTCNCAGWLADGKIICAKGTDLLLVNSDGSKPQKIASNPDGVAWPRSSPDGGLIRFAADTGTLWEVTASGSNLHQLLPGWNNPLAEDSGSWTPNGRYFLFQSAQKGGTEIWARREKGDLFRKVNREPVQLTTGPMGVSGAVSSRDGKKLFALGSVRGAQLMRFDARSHQLEPFMGGISAQWVDFSKDGDWITYSTFPGDTVWRSKSDGSERIQLTFPPLMGTMPRWSPDGKQIAFQGTTNLVAGNLYVVPAGGATPELLPTQSADPSDPYWAPDGQHLVYTSNGSHVDLADLRVIDMRTHAVSTIPGSHGLGNPRWSPDGRYLVASEAGDSGAGDAGLTLFDPRNESWSELVKLSAWRPSWSRDSKFVYFLRAEKGVEGIYRVRLSDHNVEMLLGLGNLKWRVSNDLGAPSFSVALDNSLLLTLDTGNTEVYALDVSWP